MHHSIIPTAKKSCRESSQLGCKHANSSSRITDLLDRRANDGTLNTGSTADAALDGDVCLQGKARAAKPPAPRHAPEMWRNRRCQAYRHLLVEAAPRNSPFQLGGLLLLQVQRLALGVDQVSDLREATRGAQNVRMPRANRRERDERDILAPCHPCGCNESRDQGRSSAR